MNSLKDYIKMISELEIPKTLKKIKVSPKLYYLINNIYNKDLLYGLKFSPEAMTFQGVTIEIDYDKEDYAYEEVYGEN